MKVEEVSLFVMGAAAQGVALIGLTYGRVSIWLCALAMVQGTASICAALLVWNNRKLRALLTEYVDKLDEIRSEAQFRRR